MNETFEAIKIDVPQHPLYMRNQSSDLANYVQIFIKRYYACTEFLPNVRFIIDCGAYVGYSAAWFLSKFLSCTLIAIEPDAQNFALLQENLKPYKNVSLLKKALWAVSNMQMQRITKKFHDGLQWSYQCEPHPQGAIESISLNKIIQQFGAMDKIDLLKIDIEGAEAVLFSNNCSEWMQKVENIAIELHNDSVFGNATQAFINACGDQFSIQRFGEITFARRRK